MCDDGPGGGHHCRTTLVYVVELLTVLRGFALVLDLGGHGRNAWTAHCCDFSLLWPCCDATSAAVIGDAVVDGRVIDDDSAVVDIGDVDVDAVDGTVVVKVVAVPVAAVITGAGVAKTVVDATVEADMQAPEATMKAVAVVIPAPVAGGPEGAVVGRSAPGAGNPVVAGGSPLPIAGGPDVVGRGCFRLLIDGQRRRRLVGIFDRRSLAFFVELLDGLGVRISLIVLIGRCGSGLLRGILLRRIGLLRRILLLGRILLVTLLRLGLIANSEYCPLSCGGGRRQRLASGN